MCALAVLETRPGGCRPPIEPPSRTGFGPSDGNDPAEPMHRVIADSVQQVLRASNGACEESLPLFLRLIEQRRKLVEQELRMCRLLAPEPLPPLLRNFYTLDTGHVEEEPVKVYKRLLNELDHAKEILERQFKELNPPSLASEG
jgi:hypothetical protein